MLNDAQAIMLDRDARISSTPCTAPRSMPKARFGPAARARI